MLINSIAHQVAQQKISPPLAKKAKHSNTAVSIKDSEDDSVDELSPSKPGRQIEPTTGGKAPQSRASLSTVDTPRDSVESSGYSTPGTSAVATPGTSITVK